MSFVVTAPETVVAAASQLTGIGSVIEAANAAAAALTTRLLPAAADEVSAGIAALMSTHAQEYQLLGGQLATYHDQLVQALDRTAGWYADAETGNAALLRNVQQELLTGLTAPGRAWSGAGAASAGASGVDALMSSALLSGGRSVLVVGSTGTPRPSYRFMREVYDLFVAPHYFGDSLFGVQTPAQFQPFTGIPNLTFDESAATGASYLHAAITQQLADGNRVVVAGFSQGASVATLEMRHLQSLPIDSRPSPEDLSFVLLGNPNNPNGGILARFPGLYIQSVGLTFNGATPVTEYPTTVYTTQYDGFADFPQYPLNVVADVNALLGISYSHSLYYGLTPDQVAAGVVLPVSSPDVNTTYILIPNEHLPLLQPLRGIVPDSVLDGIEPGLRDVVELGYDRTGYADVPTPASLFPANVNPNVVAGAFVEGAVRGIDNGLAGMGLPPLPDLPAAPLLPEIWSNAPPIPGWPASVPSAIAVPPQLGGAIAGPLDHLYRTLDSVINGQINPAITSGIYQYGADLSAEAARHGASSELLNAIYAGRQVLPILIEGPGVILTADTYYSINAIKDLAAGNLSGFNQNLQLIPATNAMLLTFGATIPIAAGVSAYIGRDFP